MAAILAVPRIPDKFCDSVQAAYNARGEAISRQAKVSLG